MYVEFLKLKRDKIRSKIREAFHPTYDVFIVKYQPPFNLFEFDGLWNELTNIQLALFEKFGVDGYG